MSIQRVMPGSSGAALVDMIHAHVGLHDQRDANKARVGNAVVRHDPAQPLSRALPHPARRPAFLKTGGPAHGDKGVRKSASRRDLARADTGDEAELARWPRMEAGDRMAGPIPSNDLMGVAVRSEPVHGRRMALQRSSGHAPTRRSVPTMQGRAQAVVAVAARQAMLGRDRACAWLFRQPESAGQVAV